MNVLENMSAAHRSTAVPAQHMEGAVIYIVESCFSKLNAAYAHVRSEDDEYAVPCYAIAESSIIVDCEPLPEHDQTRSRFNVIAHGAGTHEQMLRMQETHNGKVRLTVSHIHQFGYHPSLSGTDIQGFRRVLENPEASKPYSDGSHIPVILVTDSGARRKYLGFFVTPSTVYPAKLVVIRDDSPLVTEAWEQAPVAVPDQPGAELAELAQRSLGPGWTVRLARSKKSGITAILLVHRSGKEFVIEVGASFPYGRPRLLRKGNGEVKRGVWTAFFDATAMVRQLVTGEQDTIGFSVHFSRENLPVVVAADGVVLDEEIAFLNHVDWSGLGEYLVADPQEDELADSRQEEERA